MIRAAIFDLDGVIVDTAKYHFSAWKRLASELGFDFTEADNERLKGVSRMKSLDILLEVGGVEARYTDAEKQELASRKNGWYVADISRMTESDILPGVLSFLHEVRADERSWIALGSASKNTGIILERLGIEWLFDKVVDGTMVTRTKPDPEVFLKCAERVDGEESIPSSECIVFEDAVAGIAAAKSAKMYGVGVGSRDILQQADIVISGFENVTWQGIKEKFNTICK